MTTFAEIAETLENQGAALEKFMADQKSDLSELRHRIDQSEAKANRPAGFGGSAQRTEPTAHMLDVKSGRHIPVYAPGQQMAERKSDMPSIGRVLRGIVLGGQAPDAAELADERKAMSVGQDPSGGFTVAGQLSSAWIDLLRSEMALVQAGTASIPMDGGTLTLARITADPAVYWHGENQALADSQPTLGAVTLSAKTVTCLVKLSLELSQDSSNVEQILTSSITSAMASAIDSAGLNGATGAGSALAPSGLFNLADRNVISAVGEPTNYDFLIDGLHSLALANVPMGNVGALIAHPSLWRKLAKLKTGLASDQTTLVPPAEIANLRKIWTTAAPLAGNTTKAVLGDWRDLMFGVRQNISVRVLSEAFMGSNLQVALLAVARVDFAATRAKSFTTLEGVTI